MSALTDVFTALANKIRSKTGTSTTYTPSQMVSNGIDDVYDAGYAAGGGGGVTPTSITPSNSSPASMTAGNAYEPTANGYAISSYTRVTPLNTSPVGLSSGSIYKMDSSGFAINTYSNLTPSDYSSPVSLQNSGVYKPTESCYAISSYTDISPSSSGTYFASGMNNMSTSGYAYSSKPSPSFSATTLWSNSSLNAPFALQTITLSSGISSYTYIRITWGNTVGSLSSMIKSNMMVAATALSSMTDAASKNFIALGARGASGSARYYRRVYYASNTSLQFHQCYNESGTLSNSYCIPISIEGLK